MVGRRRSKINHPHFSDFGFIAALVLPLLFLMPRTATADCKASISASPGQSQVTLTATATGGNCGNTRVTIFDPVTGINSVSNTCAGTTCTVTRTILTYCQREGVGQMAARAECTEFNANQVCINPLSGTATTEYPIHVVSPSSSLNLAPPDISGNRAWTVNYSFAGIGAGGGRLELYFDGGLYAATNVSTESGVWQGSIGTACLNGTHQFQAVAVSCGGDSNYLPFFGFSSVVPVTAPKPTVSVDVATAASPPLLTVHYSFPGTTSAAQRRVQLIAAKSGQIIAEIQPSTATGDWQQTLAACQFGSDSEMLVALATACGGEQAEDATAVVLPECDHSCSKECPSCTRDPIRVTNGNMRLYDKDLLPGAPIAPLARTYDSKSSVLGAFGKGWTALFDAWLRNHSVPNGRDIVMIGTEGGDRAVFVRHDNVYDQIWPSGEHVNGTLIYDATAATFTYREAGASMARVFRASDGRLVALRSLSGQYEMDITYSNGIPTRVADSRGNVSWTITSNANGLIDTVSVDGQPNLVWTYQYDANNNLTSVKIGSLVWRTYAYGSSGLTEARDNEGRLIESHNYDANGNAIDSSAATDDISSIQYNAAGSRMQGETVTHVTYATGRATDYYSRFIGGKMRTVELKGSCSCGTDEAAYAYDTRGHIVREQNASGYITTSTYDSLTRNLLSTSTAMKPANCDPSTAADRCRLDPDSLAAASLAETPATLTTTYGYNDPNWPDKPTSIAASSVVSGQQRRESRAYHPTTGETVAVNIDGFRPPGERIAADTATQSYGDPAPPAGDDRDGAAPAPLAPAFDPGGAFLSAWLALPQPSGLPRSTDGPRVDVDDVTSFVYYPVDASVPALLRGRLAATKNAAGHITRFESYDVFGNVARSVDANGVATESSYDALGRLLTTTTKAVNGCDTSADPLCATDLAATLTYFPAGPLKSDQRPSGGLTAYTYDNRGRVATLSRGPSITDLREQIAYTYDPATGRKSLEQYLAFENGAWAEKRRESFGYDSFARLITVTHADGTSISYTYDEQGRIASARDENHPSANTLYTYDAGGRLATVKQTLSTAPGGQIATSYAYDRQGNLTSVTDPNGNVTSYDFDDLGRMVKQSSPVTGVTTYEYDPAGNLVSMTDANGVTTTRQYDVLDRVVSTGARRGTNPPATDDNGRGGGSPGNPPPASLDSESVAWTYDDATAGRFGLGRVASMSDPSGATTYNYERRGLLRSETRTFRDTTYAYTTTFGYDADANRSLIAYPSGQLSVAYTFDYAGRPLTASGVVTGAEYRPFGPLSKLQFANGTTQTLDQDNRYRVASNELAVNGVPPGQGRIARYIYGYDAAGNIANLQDTTDTSYHRTFAYDDMNRLIQANTPPNGALWETATYSWDAMGNILHSTMERTTPEGPENLPLSNPKRFQPPNKPKKKSAQSVLLGRAIDFTYSGSTSLLSSVAFNGVSHGVTSDAAGNETGYFATRAYSAWNLLSEVHDQTDPEEEAPHVLRYGYDGRGLRVERTESPSSGIGTSVHRFFFYTPELTLLVGTHDDGPNVWEGDDATPLAKNIRYEIVWFGGRPVAQVTPGAAPLFTFADHLGTPLLQTDSSQNITWRVEYEPFGNVYEVRAGTRTDQPLRFPGQDVAMTWEGPEENSNVFRWYQSGWGRYTSPDPILGTDPSSNEAYGYAKQNPLLFTDPFGLLAEAICSEIAWNGINTPFYHCRIRVTCKECTGGKFGGPFDTTVGLERNRKTGDLYIDERTSYSGRHYNLGVSEADSCNFGKCVRSTAAYFKQFANNWKPQWSPTGANSNTFAGHLARTCGATGQPYWAPGWNEPPFFKY